VYDQVVGVLSKFGLSGFDAVGEMFDPHVHEAVAVLPSDRQPKDVVIQQVRRGYRLGDLLLRPAQVVLSGGLPETATELPPASGVEE
jgi:molecular chaperone GrpE